MSMMGLYIHIPFCERKCIYCDFYSEVGRRDFDIYIDFLIKEIILYAEKYSDSEVQTIYFGGGTPSLLDPLHYEKLLKTIRANFKIIKSPEITIEVNPGTVDQKKLGGYLDVGINRLSIGVQSFQDVDLDFLSRIHTADQGEKCIIDSYKTGFKNVSMDIMYGLPTQTIMSLEYTLKKALSYSLQHISAYTLVIESRTPLAKSVRESRLQLISEEAEAEMMEFLIEYLKKNGYAHYEISNFALPGFECIHNKNYWNHSNYIGFGPSAHSFFENKRWWNVDTIFNYYNRLNNNLLPIEGSEVLDENKLINEIFMLGLRSDGINFKQLQDKFGRNFLPMHIEKINELVKTGMAVFENYTLRLTTKGLLIADEICNQFINLT